MECCNTCRHWDRDYNLGWMREMEGEFTFTSHHENDKTPLKRESYRPCKRTIYQGGYEHEGSKALAVDGETYYAALYTAPDFYCNQYEAKE